MGKVKKSFGLFAVYFSYWEYQLSPFGMALFRMIHRITNLQRVQLEKGRMSI